MSGNYFSLLGVRPGRGPAAGPGRRPGAVGASGGGDQRRLLEDAVRARSGRLSAGRLSLSGVPFTIVGVTPPEFFGVEVGTAPQIFVPVMMQPVVMPVTENLLDRPIDAVLDMAPVVAPFEAGRVSRAGGRAALDMAGAGGRLEAAEQVHGGRADRRQHSTLTSAATGLSDLRSQFSLPLSHPHGRRRHRPADRVREHGESDPGSVGGAPSGVRRCGWHSARDARG